MKSFLKKIHGFFSFLFFDPLFLLIKWRSIPSYIVNIFKYLINPNKTRFKIKFSDLYCVTYEKFQNAGIMKGHYFFQDI